MMKIDDDDGDDGAGNDDDDDDGDDDDNDADGDDGDDDGEVVIMVMMKIDNEDEMERMKEWWSGMQWVSVEVTDPPHQQERRYDCIHLIAASTDDHQRLVRKLRKSNTGDWALVPEFRPSGP